jgi:hypothetical protein
VTTERGRNSFPRLQAGNPFTQANRRTAEFTLDVVKDELPRVRAAALAWRNGVGGLLAGLIGFGLIKGRSDIGDLAPTYAAVVGVLLALALLSGLIAALLLLRAAHGRPGPVKIRRLLRRTTRTASDRGAPDHRETVLSARSLLAGVILAILCLTFLSAAVGTIWYGPPTEKPRIKATTAGDETCGEVVRAKNGILTLKREDGVQVDVPLKDMTALQAVVDC